jgi:hypothetical protein
VDGNRGRLVMPDKAICGWRASRGSPNGAP